jgi:hypothetical protein
MPALQSQYPKYPHPPADTSWCCQSYCAPNGQQSQSGSADARGAWRATGATRRVWPGRGLGALITGQAGLMPEVPALQRMHVIDSDERRGIDLFDQGTHGLPVPPRHGGVDDGQGAIATLTGEFCDGEARLA